MKRSIVHLGMGVAFTAATLLSGCVTEPSRPADNRVTVAPELCTRVWITDVRLSKATSLQWTLHATLANSARKVTPLDYKVMWLDASGLEISSVVSTWQQASLAPLEVREITATAPSPAAVDFRLYVKEAR